ncbi:hypothetical protein L9F63_019190, partial [Diploptera punctata]
EMTCGDLVSERLTYFQSPSYPQDSAGTLACDYDILVHDDVCAMRIEFVNVKLARKFGGVCDIDQITILNSVDGPTAAQCGPLSGYVRPKTCGRRGHESRDLSNSGAEHIMSLFPNLITLWYDDKWKTNSPPTLEGARWWDFPEPIFNTYYFDIVKKHMHMAHKPAAEERIVGGMNAEQNEFPWMVAIFFYNDLFFCGGALINKEYVLTAAHCIMTRDTTVEDLLLQIGDYDLTTPNETQHVTRSVQNVIYHSHFHPFLLNNDIALLHLDKPVVFTNNIQPVCLPEPGQMYTGRRSKVIGWGVTGFPVGEPSPVLQKLEVETMSNYQCSHIIEEPVGLGMLCAAPSSAQGTCFGDSGGPLTTVGDDGKDVLIGVVSFGVAGCAVIPAFPDLYTRVSEYLKWIDVNAVT